MRFTSFAAIVAALCLISLSTVSADSSDLLIPTASGSVLGFISSQASSTARAWLGIPYAAPPNGTSRMLPPQPVEDWTGTTLVAQEAGPGCIQSCDLPPGLCPAVTSEDCLYLNVFAPVYPSSSSLPVMVFIHGGNFRQGAGWSGMYDGTIFVNTSDVVLVSMNYRLGAFGFYYSNLTYANNGLLDQQMALAWVNQNILAFGGNPNQVTIFGQSAGATSVSSHLQNPISRQYFQQAILESIPLGISLRYPTESEGINSVFAGIVNCDVSDLLCVQALTPEAVQVAGEQAITKSLAPDGTHWLEVAQSWEPTVGVSSFLIPLGLIEFYQGYASNPAVASIPLIMGTVSEEAFVFIYEALPTTPLTKFEVEGIETLLFGFKGLIEFADLYPLTSGQDNRPALSDIGSDELFTCAARNATNAIAPVGNEQTHVWSYLFSHLSQDGSHGWGPNYTICWTHVCHGSELPYVFGSAAAVGSTFTPAETELSQTMITYWTNFAKSGNPNVGAPVDYQWPLYSADTREILNLDIGELTLIDNIRHQKCDVMDQWDYQL